MRINAIGKSRPMPSTVRANNPSSTRRKMTTPKPAPTPINTAKVVITVVSEDQKRSASDRRACAIRPPNVCPVISFISPQPKFAFPFERILTMSDLRGVRSLAHMTALENAYPSSNVTLPKYLQQAIDTVLRGLISIRIQGVASDRLLRIIHPLYDRAGDRVRPGPLRLACRCCERRVRAIPAKPDWRLTSV